MHITIADELEPIYGNVTPGNVYTVRGGEGARFGHMHVILAVTTRGMCPCVTVNKEGNIVGASSYARHYFADKTPVAFVDGIEDIELNMRNL